MSSAFERLQKLAEEKRLKEKASKPVLEIIPVNTELQPSAVSAGSSPSAPSARSQKLSIAPEKDFTKVANSIVRQIPNGAFIGKSKQLYDYLYSLTRGAINPTRSVRASKSGLMRGSGIKSTHTFYNNVRHLEAIGLIIITRIDGEKGGNSYEVLLPEEIKGDLEHIAQLAQSEQLAQSVQKLPLAVSAVSALTALGSNPINIGVSDAPKTSLKTNTNDDDYAFAIFVEKIQTAAEEETGKKISKRERENLGKLADLLILELKIAARRTENISSVPAFLTEVLRRKLRDPSENPKPAKAKVDIVGKPDSGTYEIKPLDKKGKEAALEQLREFADDEFLQEFKKWYTSDDWSWLIKQLEKE